MVGFYDEEGIRDSPGEVFVVVAKHGSDLSHFIDAWATMVSIALQYGVAWEMIRSKFTKYQHPRLIEDIVNGIEHCIQQRRAVISE